MMTAVAVDHIERQAASEAGRALNAMRRKVQGRCEACGELIIGVKQKKWCGDRCAKRGERQRKRQRVAAVSRFLRR